MIYLVRHGQTVFNREGRLQGHVDSDLTELGVEQARRVGALVAGLVGAADGWRIVSSPLGRAMATAGHVAEALGGAEVITAPALIEVSFGAWDGRLRTDLQAEYPDTFGPSGYTFNSPGCESYESVVGRVQTWLDALPPEPERKIIAVSHGVTGRVLRGLYARMSRQDALDLPVPQDAAFRLAGGVIERIDA